MAIASADGIGSTASSFGSASGLLNWASSLSSGGAGNAGGGGISDA